MATANVSIKPDVQKRKSRRRLKVPEPLYIRLPREGVPCRYTSLGRTALDLLVRPQKLNNFKPPVKSKLLQVTGERLRARLIDFASLKAYLASLPDGDQVAKKEAA